MFWFKSKGHYLILLYVADMLMEPVTQLRNEEEKCEEAEARVRELEKQVPTFDYYSGFS